MSTFHRLDSKDHQNEGHGHENLILEPVNMSNRVTECIEFESS